jgi:hypothetical protein
LQNVRFLAEAEQVRIYGRFKLFLDGLGFPLKCISLVEAADAARDPALVAQQHALSELDATPQLQKLQQQSLLHQHGSLQHCTTTRHFVVISASTRELAQQRGDGTARSPLLRLFELVAPKKHPAVTPEQVKHELRIRVSLVKKALQHLDVQARVLDDAEALQVSAACLAPGTPLPSFEVEVLDEREQAQQVRSATPTAVAHTSAAASAQSAVAKSIRVTGSTKQDMSPRRVHRLWKKRIQGLDRALVYSSTNPQTRLEQDAVRLADLVAPSAVTLLNDAVEVTVRGEKRHLRYYEVIGFAPDLLCGWQEELTSLALPMIVTTRCHPIDSRLMIKKLELHLTKLESQKLADQKALRLTKVDQKVEAEQVRSVIDALARKKLSIFAVQMVIGIHAGDPERLEQRAKYLLSHLREMQLRVRALGRQHDRGWQACVPADLARLDAFTNWDGWNAHRSLYRHDRFWLFSASSLLSSLG